MDPSNSNNNNNNKKIKRQRNGSAKETSVSKATTTTIKKISNGRSTRKKDAKLRANKSIESTSKDDEQFISSEIRTTIANTVRKSLRLKSCNPSTVLQLFEIELELEYINVEEIERIFNQHDNSNHDSDNDDNDNNQQQIQYELEQLAVRYSIQTEKAKFIFRLLDKERRDFIVIDDLREVADEIFNSVVTNNKDSTVGDDELHQMVQEFNPDGILSCPDFIRIARIINL